MILALVWFLRIVLFPLGIACFFVALDMLHVWGIDTRPRERLLKPSVKAYRRPLTAPYALRSGSPRPHPNAWVWWEWRIRRPAFYLLLLGMAMVAIGILLWLPGFGNLPRISERLPGIGLFVLGLTLLRGTLKISSPLIWKRVTLIKRPLSGRARPSLAWMGLGFVFSVAGLYGVFCDFAPLRDCLSIQWTGTVASIGELIFGGLAATGFEDLIQAIQESDSPKPRAFILLGIGLAGFIGFTALRSTVP